tara:strand:+ start:2630 stop:2902 length:273 start_codon:yes stop_codon:yes gene_type:complete
MIIFVLMIAPKLPSFFKSSPHRKFSFKARYYNKRKEELKRIIEQNNSTNESIKFDNPWGPSRRAKSNKNSKRTILLIVIALLAISYLLLK